MSLRHQAMNLAPSEWVGAFTGRSPKARWNLGCSHAAWVLGFPKTHVMRPWLSNKVPANVGSRWYSCYNNPFAYIINESRLLLYHSQIRIREMDIFIPVGKAFIYIYIEHWISKHEKHLRLLSSGTKLFITFDFKGSST